MMSGGRERSPRALEVVFFFFDDQKRADGDQRNPIKMEEPRGDVTDARHRIANRRSGLGLCRIGRHSRQVVLELTADDVLNPARSQQRPVQRRIQSIGNQPAKGACHAVVKRDILWRYNLDRVIERRGA